MKQTAVEWLVEQLRIPTPLYTKNPLIEQAKEIEKEQQDEFAIGFAKYVLINNGKYKYIDLEKMLKLFKKEKGL